MGKRLILTLVFLLAFAAVGSAEDVVLEASVQKHLDSLPDDATRLSYLEGVAKDRPEDWAVQFHLGNFAYDSGKLDVAAGAYEKCLASNPTLVGALVNLGSVYDELGQLDEALTTYKKALELDPSEDKTYCNIGGVYFTKRQFGLAMENFQKALEINPKSQLAHYNIAILFADSGIYDEAIVEWQAAVDLDPNSDLGKRSYDNIGIIQEMKNASVPDLNEKSGGGHEGHNH